MDTRAAAARWADTWRRAWEALDVDPIAALYADDARLTTQPFRDVDLGRTGVTEYVTGAFAEEREVRAWFGEPVVDGDRASVEWWAALLEDGAEVTLAGTSIAAVRCRRPGGRRSATPGTWHPGGTSRPTVGAARPSAERVATAYLSRGAGSIGP